MTSQAGSELLFFLYGSATGNSESIAKRLHHEAITTRGYLAAQCMTLNQAFAQKVLDAQSTEDAPHACFVIVCSTTGEGEPPDNATRFRRGLRNFKGALHHLRFTVLALGDSNYNNFCAAGVYLDGKLKEYGGERFYARGEADDGIGLDLVVDPWTENLWGALNSGGASVGSETYQIGDQRVDMSVPQETAIIYCSASQVCATHALFMYERIAELGGKADLYPIQYFRLDWLVRPVKVALFILCTDSDERTLCERCAQCTLPPPLGPFTELLLSEDDLSPLSESSRALREWLADASIRFYNAVCVVAKQSSVPLATTLDANIKKLTASCKLESLSRRIAADEVPTIAIHEDDLFRWSESVLDALPGITADINVIQRSLTWFFDVRVGAAFREATLHESCDPIASDVQESQTNASRTKDSVAADASTTASVSRAVHKYHIHHTAPAAAAGEAIVGETSSRMINDLLTPLVFLYSGESALVDQVAHDIYEGAAAHHLRASLTDMTHFRHSGFPRRATFIFILSGTLTRAMNAVLKQLRALRADGKRFDGVKFAILGLDEPSRGVQYNVCALELETLLLSLAAMKIHCTGLADLESAKDVLSVVQAWESSLWSAIMHPTASAAYLDAASLGVGGGQSTSFSSTPLAEAGGHTLNERPTAPDRVLSFSNEANEDVQRAALAVPPADPPRDLNKKGAQGEERGEAAAITTREPTSLLQWDAVPLNRKNIPQTPLALLYSSSGMPKAMAMHALEAAKALGFYAEVHSFAHFGRVNVAVIPNLVLFCTADGRGGTGGGRRFKKFLQNPANRPDCLSNVRFGVLGLGAPVGSVEHPAFWWSNALSRLQANRVFPVMLMPSMSQVHALGVPWCECVFSSMALLAPLRVTSSPEEHAVLLHRQHSGLERPERRILFLFGSSTGTTEAIARDLHREALERGFYSRVAALKYFEKMNFLSAETVVIVCGTVSTNAGAYPDNAYRFARYIHRKSHPPTLLSNVRFAVLGMGGSGSPDMFCKAATRIDRQLGRLGGQRLCALGKINETFGIAEPVERWRRTLFDALQRSVNDKRSSYLSSEPTLRSRWAGSADGTTGAEPATPPRTSERPATRVLLVCGSPPSGVVADISAHLNALLRSRSSVHSTMCTMDDFIKMHWYKKYHLLVFLVAVNDQGDCPFRSTAFFRALRRQSCPSDMFAAYQYTILAVAENNAGSFYIAQRLDSRLSELGGTRFYPRGEAVDSFSLEKTVERWISGFMATLTIFYEVGGADGDDSLPEGPVSSSSIVDRLVSSATNGPNAAPTDGVIHSWRRLTAESAPCEVIALNLTVPRGTRWIPGQTVAIPPANAPPAVNRLLRRFGLRGEEPFHPLSVAGAESSSYPNAPLYSGVEFPVSCRTVLLRYVSLRVTKANKTLFDLLESHAPSAEVKQAVQQAYNTLATKRVPCELVDVLDALQSISPPFRHVLEHLSLLQPRTYSISSSQAKTPTQLSLCFKVVPHGLCTNWLAEQCRWADARGASTSRRAAGEVVEATRRCVISFVIRPATEFRMPRDPLIPLILIGPGTGVAPFMAFLEEREVWLRQRRGLESRNASFSDASAAHASHAGASADPTDAGEALEYPATSASSHGGTIDLFFGCRRRAEDFLFKDELSHFVTRRVLSSLSTAFSREPNDGAYWYGGCYVQDRLAECDVALCELITQRNAHVYVCGDADRMAKEVHRTLIELLQHHLCLTDAAAREYMEQLAKSGKYIRDVWSSSPM